MLLRAGSSSLRPLQHTASLRLEHGNEQHVKTSSICCNTAARTAICRDIRHADTSPNRYTCQHITVPSGFFYWIFWKQRKRRLTDVYQHRKNYASGKWQPSQPQLTFIAGGKLFVIQMFLATLEAKNFETSRKSAYKTLCDTQSGRTRCWRCKQYLHNRSERSSEPSFICLRYTAVQRYDGLPTWNKKAWNETKPCTWKNPSSSWMWWPNTETTKMKKNKCNCSINGWNRNYNKWPGLNRAFCEARENDDTSRAPTHSLLTASLMGAMLAVTAGEINGQIKLKLASSVMKGVSHYPQTM